MSLGIGAEIGRRSQARGGLGIIHDRCPRLSNFPKYPSIVCLAIVSFVKARFSCLEFAGAGLGGPCIIFATERT